MLSIVTLPVIVTLSFAHFMGAERDLPLQIDKVSQVSRSCWCRSGSGWRCGGARRRWRIAWGGRSRRCRSCCSSGSSRRRSPPSARTWASSSRWSGPPRSCSTSRAWRSATPCRGWRASSGARRSRSGWRSHPQRRARDRHREQPARLGERDGDPGRRVQHHHVLHRRDLRRGGQPLTSSIATRARDRAPRPCPRAGPRSSGARRRRAGCRPAGAAARRRAGPPAR